MGLDWQADNKPKPGHEAEFDEIRRKLDKGRRFGRRKLERRLIEISVPPVATLGAPRVGEDQRATDWVLERYPNRTDQSWSEERWLQEFDGYYVVELAPPSDGLPRYTNGGLGEYIEAYSFRAAFLEDCEDILDDTYFEAYNEREPAELVEYGKSLIEKAERYAQAHDIDLGALDTDDTESDSFKLDVVLSAGRWCIYWGERGHAMRPWF
jgi:hypothetical protein